MAFGEDKHGIGNDRRSKRSHERRVLEVLADPYLESVWKMYSRARYSLPYEERMLNLTWRIMGIKSKRSGMKGRKKGAEEGGGLKVQEVGAGGGWCEDEDFRFLSMEGGNYCIEEEKRVGGDHEHGSSGLGGIEGSLYDVASGATIGKSEVDQGSNEPDSLLQNMLTHIEGYGTELVLYKAEAGEHTMEMEGQLRGSPRLDNTRALLVEPTMLVSDASLSNLMIDYRGGQPSPKENGQEQVEIGDVAANARKTTQVTKCVRKKSLSKVHSSRSNLSVSAFNVPEVSSKEHPVSATSKSGGEQEQEQQQQQQSATASKANIYCTNCRTKTTPLWRRDPHGNPLCNACGLFLKLHGVVRPLSLKTDVIKKRQRSSNRNNNGSAKNSSESPQSASSSPVCSGGSERRRPASSFQITRRKPSTVRPRESFTAAPDLRTIAKNTIEPLCMTPTATDKNGLELPLGTSSDDIYSSFSRSMRPTSPAKFPDAAGLGVLSSSDKMDTRDEQAPNLGGSWEWLTLSL